MIIELAGLPGAGKTTLCKALKYPAGGKGSVSLLQLRADGAFRRAARSLLCLAASARPLRINRFTRAINAAVLLRHYQPGTGLIVLDQGMVQKVWSLLADADAYPAEALDRLLSDLVPFAPDHLVWLETPLDLAVTRMGRRPDGNSRYDDLPEDDARRLLTGRADLLRTIAETYAAKAGLSLFILDGTADVHTNSAELDRLISG